MQIYASEIIFTSKFQTTTRQYMDSLLYATPFHSIHSVVGHQDWQWNQDWQYSRKLVSTCTKRANNSFYFLCAAFLCVTFIIITSPFLCYYTGVSSIYAKIRNSASIYFLIRTAFMKTASLNYNFRVVSLVGETLFKLEKTWGIDSFYYFDINHDSNINNFKIQTRIH